MADRDPHIPKPRPPADGPSSDSYGSSSPDDPTRELPSDYLVRPSSSGSFAGPAGPPPRPRIEGYELLEEVHRGGQGVVYRAVQLGTKREVALKVLLEGPFASETSRRRFEREIELAANLRHPNIVTILDSGLSLGRYYFVMEYIRGERLDRYLARERPPFERVLELLAKVCDAVNFAHQRGVIHRDLKPPNILVDESGEPRILDFGLAKHVALANADTTVRNISTSGQILGTVAYMSPEQASGSLDVDVRSDVYALGVIFYEVLVGQPPYAVVGPLGEILNNIAHTDAANPRSLARVSSFAREVDDEVATILMKALEKEPGRRYQTAGELARDLRHRLAGDPIEAKRASGLYMFKKTLRRYRLQATAAATILLMLVAFLIIFVVLFSSERQQRQRAAAQTHIAQAQRAEALAAQAQLRHALIRQHIQQGDLALTRNDLMAARDAYWNALELTPETGGHFTPDPASLWALRRYYLASANAGTQMLTLTPPVQVTFSPEGRLAATADAAGVTVVDVASGLPVRWLPLPAAPTYLTLRDDGVVVVGGEGWTRRWNADGPAPTAAVDLPEFLRPIVGAYAGPGADTLILIGTEQVALYHGRDAQLVNILPLQGRDAGAAAYAPQRRLLAVATSVGLELVAVGDDRLAGQIAWHNVRPARDVRFIADDRLIVLDAVPAAGAQPAQSVVLRTDVTTRGLAPWTVLLQAPEPADLVDWHPGANQIVLATHAGSFAVYRGTTRVATWSAGDVDVVALRLSAAQRALLSLDSGGALTSWISPERVEQRRRVADADVAGWASSLDAETSLLVMDNGAVVAYRPTETPAVQTLLPRRLFGMPTGGVDVALGADGRRAVIRDGRTLRFIDFTAGTRTALPWNDPELSVPEGVALRPDGEEVALLVRTREGDRQEIRLIPWPAADSTRANFDAAHAAPALEFVGAVIRKLLYLPGSNALLVIRSNGQVHRITSADLGRTTAPASDTGTQTAPRRDVWWQLDAVPRLAAVSLDGRWLAIAAEDRTVRLRETSRVDAVQPIVFRSDVTSLSFNPRDDLLLVRTADGDVQLVDPVAQDVIARWPLADAGPHPLGLWAGIADAMLLQYADAVYELRYQQADALIERNRPFAQQRKAVAALTAGDPPGAWEALRRLQELAPALGQCTRVEMLATLLRRPELDVPDVWLDSVLPLVTPTQLLELGHAAYAGGRFGLAGRCLRRAAEQLSTPMDATTAWRLAEITYLADDYTTAAQELGEVLARPDFYAAHVPTAALEQVAALVLANDLANARRAAANLGLRTNGPAADIVAVSAARVVARFISGLESEELLTSGLEGLVTTFAEDSLRYRDDVHFFRGELARASGDLAAAAVQYQRCIDLSRDRWPANWSRYRLAQLERHAGGTPRE